MNLGKIAAISSLAILGVNLIATQWAVVYLLYCLESANSGITCPDTTVYFSQDEVKDATEKAND